MAGKDDESREEGDDRTGADDDGVVRRAKGIRLSAPSPKLTYVLVAIGLALLATAYVVSNR